MVADRLADGALDLVKTPTLLIVGGEDVGVIELNRLALNRLQGEKGACDRARRRRIDFPAGRA